MPDLESFKPQGMLHEGWSTQVDDYALACGWTEQGKNLLVADVSGGINAFDGHSGSKLWNIKEAHQGGLLTMAIHPSGNKFATAGQDGCVDIRESQSGETISHLELGKGWVEHLSWSKDGSQLAVACSRRVHVFDVDGRQQWCSREHPSTVSAISWSKPNELATACYGNVTFYDVIKDKINQKLEWQGSLVSMVLNPCGDIVACGSQDNSVHFWRRSTGHDAEMTGYPGKPSHLAFDQSGQFLATGGSEQITVWNFKGDGPEGTLPGQLNLHPEAISSLIFANHGQILASGSRDGSVFVWLLDKHGDGNPLGGAFLGERISSIIWKPDDSAIAAIDANGGVSLWPFRLRT